MFFVSCFMDPNISDVYWLNNLQRNWGYKRSERWERSHCLHFLNDFILRDSNYFSHMPTSSWCLGPNGDVKSPTWHSSNQEFKGFWRDKKNYGKIKQSFYHSPSSLNEYVLSGPCQCTTTVWIHSADYAKC